MLRRIKIDWGDLPDSSVLETPFLSPERLSVELKEITAETFPAFLEEIGLVGMGGGGFSAAQKLRACIGAHTLVINGVECEPGITIDQAVLLHHARWVRAGAEASATASGAKRIVLAVTKNKKFRRKMQELYPDYMVISFPNRYPAGAESLILKKLMGAMPPTGMRPHEFGYLVQNVVSLRAAGRALLDGIPMVERPLTVTMPAAGFYKNIVAPIGLPLHDVFSTVGLNYDPQQHRIISGGLMMGHEVLGEDCITPTMTSLILLEHDAQRKDAERACIRCGACNTACPLGLHPFALTELIHQGDIQGSSVQVQMAECFLCGVCSAVCPAHIPLVETLAEGKACLL